MRETNTDDRSEAAGALDGGTAFRRRACRGPMRPALLAGVAMITAGVVALVPGSGALPEARAAGTAGAAGSRPFQAMQTVLDDLVQAGAPGAVAQVRSGAVTRNFTSGVADLITRRPPRPDVHVRIGSVTKVFVATVILQLVAEGRLHLSDTVEQLLPGVVTGNGNDGSAITVRMLLNHTSGLYDYTSDQNFSDLFYQNPFLYFTANDLVRIATSHSPDFAPGTKWEYSNTNYILLGMVIDRVTRHTYATEITRRIIKPLGLRETYLAGHDPNIRAPHMHGYTRSPNPPNQIEDRTRFDDYGADGEIISTMGDLNRFISAELAERLLPARILHMMLKPTVAAGRAVPYGLGIEIVPTLCGVTVYGHVGEVYGSSTWVAGTLGGRRSVALNHNDDYTATPIGDTNQAVFCPPRGGSGRPPKSPAHPPRLLPSTSADHGRPPEPHPGAGSYQVAQTPHQTTPR